MPDLNTAQLAWTNVLRQAHGGTFSDAYEMLPVQFWSAVLGWENTVGASVPTEAVKGTAGIVPLNVAFTRIAHDNPTLSLAGRLGTSGGLGWVPLALAKSLNVDPRFPWSSSYVLLVRLRAIAEYRLLQYATMWDNVWNGRELSDTEWGFWAQASQTEAAGSSGYIEVARTGAADLDWGFGSGWTGTPRLISVRMVKPSFWPWCLALDEGFWKMVLLEERANGDGRVGKIWDFMIGQGLPWMLSGSSEAATLAAGASVLGGRILVRSPYAKMSGIVGDSSIARAAGLSADDIALLRGHMGVVDTMFARVPFHPDEVRNATLNVPASRYNGTVFPWTSDTDSWAGAVGQMPGVPVAPDVEHDSPFLRPEERESSWLFPVGIVAGLGLFGWYLWKRGV